MSHCSQSSALILRWAQTLLRQKKRLPRVGMEQFSIQGIHGMRSRGRVCHVKMKPCLLSPWNLPHSFEVRGKWAVPSRGLCSPSGTGSLFGKRPECSCSAPAHPPAVSRPLQALYLPSSQVGSSLFGYSLTFVERTQLLKKESYFE